MDTIVRLDDYRDQLKDFEFTAIVQDGEIFGLDTEWCSEHTATFFWSDEVHLDGEGGFASSDGGHGFAGYHRPTKTFHRYVDGPYEHCFRVVKVISTNGGFIGLDGIISIREMGKAFLAAGEAASVFTKEIGAAWSVFFERLPEDVCQELVEFDEGESDE